MRPLRAVQRLLRVRNPARAGRWGARPGAIGGL